MTKTTEFENFMEILNSEQFLGNNERKTCSFKLPLVFLKEFHEFKWHFIYSSSFAQLISKEYLPSTFNLTTNRHIS